MENCLLGVERIILQILIETKCKKTTVTITNDYTEVKLTFLSPSLSPHLSLPLEQSRLKCMTGTEMAGKIFKTFFFLLKSHLRCS